MSSVRTNFLWNASYQVLRVIIPLVTIPYLTRVLSPEHLGTYSFTYTVANYFTYFCLLGVNQYGSRECAKSALDGRELLSKTFCSIFVMQLVCGAVVSSIYCCYTLSTDGIVRTCTTIWFLWVLAEGFDIAWLFFGLEEFRLTTIRNLVVKVATVACIFTFVKDDGDLWRYCAIQSVGMFASALVLLPMLRKRVSWRRPDARDVITHIVPNLRLFAPIIAISCYMQLDKVMLGGMAGMEELAFFDNSEKVSTIPLAVIQALGTVMLPRMSVLVKEGDEGFVEESIRKSLVFSSIMGFGFCFGIIGIADRFVPVFFGVGWGSCVALMCIMAPIIPIVAWSNVLGVQYLLPHERDGEYLGSVIAGAVFNVAVNLATIPVLGAMGAAIATVAAEVAVTGTQVFMVRKNLGFAPVLKTCALLCVTGAAMALGVATIGSYMQTGPITLAIQIAAGVAIYLVLSGLVLRITDSQLISDFARSIKRR